MSVCVPNRSSVVLVLGLGAALMASVAATIGCSGQPASAGPVATSPVERGAYLVSIAGCNDCHTPMKMGAKGPEPDMSRMLSGHPDAMPALTSPPLAEGWLWAGDATNTAFTGPWGISYATNLTPDVETGFGVYTEEAFIKAIRSGRHMGAGRPIMPPMPWPAYRTMTDDDLKAIYAYLQTVPPVHNQVPAAVVASH